jgi:outer membrane protein OmpA-like peptidoglycan-associated protein
MHSKTVIVYTGTTDKKGNFTQLVTMPTNVCVGGGKHRLVLTGISPAGKSVSSTQYLVLDAKCKVHAKSKTPIRVVTAAGLGDFLFGYNSAKLTNKAKSALIAYAAILKGAKTVTITGYTQTNLKSLASRQGNVLLAKRRTKSVEKFLIHLGVKAKFVLIAKGPVNPASTTHQHLNRRVTIDVTFKN